MSAWRVAAVAVSALVCLLLASVASAEPRFSAPLFKTTGRFEVDELVATDVTADGRADLVASTDSGTVSVLPGAGDGTFRRRLTSPSDRGNWVETMHAADVNADGIPDLVLTRSQG